MRSQIGQKNEEMIRPLDSPTRKLKREVAIKVLAHKFRAIPNVLRFPRQAEVEASLNHPHIVTICTLNKLPD